MPRRPIHVISIQERDIEVLRGLFESRVMTARHISALYFEDRGDAATKRLQKLKAAGLVAERPRKPFEPAVLTLTRQGLGQLVERGILSSYPTFSIAALERRSNVSALTLRHELEVMDVKAAFYSSTESAPGFTIAEFNTWPLLNEFTTTHPDGGEATVRPDGFVRLHENSADELFEHAFFLEVDRSTESLDTLLARAQAYLAYYRTGGFAERNGGDRSSFKDFPFRVLFIFKTAERRNNSALRLAAGNPPILTQVWLTTLPEIVAEPFGEIWTRPADVRDALAGTPFDATTQLASPISYRRTFREKFLEPRLKRRSLIGAE